MMTQIFYEKQENLLLDFVQQKKYSQIILLADANTNGFCVTVFKEIFPTFKVSSLIVIPQGEQYKTLDVCSLIWNQLENLQTDKSAIFINIGGGMISDIGGFAASLYKRGIDCINIPTTLLAMVDACYGGKTGIDFNSIKNNLGTFQHPAAIYINPILLRTLDERILKSGFAESIKHALISSSSWWDEMNDYTVDDFISLMNIKKSLDTKIGIVAQDQKDTGIRQTLNFGHTIGHAIESYSLQTTTPLLHGEAILLGLIHELRISEHIFNLPASVALKMIDLKQKFFPLLSFQYTYDDIKLFLLQDKKNKDGIRMSLLKTIGDCAIQVSVSIKQIQESF